MPKHNKIQLTKGEIEVLIQNELDRRQRENPAPTRRFPFIKTTPRLSKEEKQLLIDNEIRRREEIQRQLQEQRRREKEIQKAQRRLERKKRIRRVLPVIAVIFVAFVLWLVISENIDRRPYRASQPPRINSATTPSSSTPVPKTTPVPTTVPAPSQLPPPTPPTPSPAPTPTPTSALTPTPKSTPTPTPTPTPKSTPAPTPTPKSTPAPTPTPKPAPTASAARDSARTVIARYNNLNPPTKISLTMVSSDGDKYEPVTKVDLGSYKMQFGFTEGLPYYEMTGKISCSAEILEFIYQEAERFIRAVYQYITDEQISDLMDRYRAGEIVITDVVKGDAIDLRITEMQDNTYFFKVHIYDEWWQ